MPLFGGGASIPADRDRAVRARGAHQPADLLDLHHPVRPGARQAWSIWSPSSLPELVGGTRARRHGHGRPRRAGSDRRIPPAPRPPRMTRRRCTTKCAWPPPPPRLAAMPRPRRSMPRRPRASTPTTRPCCSAAPTPCIELGRAAEALELLDKLAEGNDARPARPQVSLALGRAYGGLGRLPRPTAPISGRPAAARPGGLARYAAFLAHAGRRQEAAENLAEIDRRVRPQPTRSSAAKAAPGATWRRPGDGLTPADLTRTFVESRFSCDEERHHQHGRGDTLRAGCVMETAKAGVGVHAGIGDRLTLSDDPPTRDEVSRP